LNKLTDDLKNDHIQILEVLGKVKELGINAKEGQDKLLAARSKLLLHLKKEDDRLYPVLRKAAEADADLKGTLDLFGKEIEEISRSVADFYARYSTGGSGIEFARDFGRLLATLRMRIRREEAMLYEAYDRLAQ
jgi:hypothetical protein